MSRALDYDFDKVHLKRGIYAPQAHGQFELEQAAIRQGMAKVLSGQSALPITLVQTPAIGDGNAQNAEDEGLEGGG
jgi:hypothetical protein